MTNWQKLKSDFISGKTLSVIAKENNIPFDTVKSRHRAESWSKYRAEYKLKTSENLTNKLAEKKATEVLDEVESIIRSLRIIDDLIDKLKHEPEKLSLESLLDKKVKLLQVLGTYTGKTVQKNETNAKVTMPIPILGGLSLNMPSN